MVDVNKILTLITEGIKLKDKIRKEIMKEKDVKKRKKMLEALDKNDLAAIRDLLFDL